MRRLLDYFRLPESFVRYTSEVDPAQPQGFFAWGEDTVCFGSCSTVKLASSLENGLQDICSRVHTGEGGLHLPFDPDQLIDNLLLERYPINGSKPWSETALATLYYGLRPLLAGNIRKHLQRLYLAGWQNIRFPRWPVDVSAERIREHCLASLMKAQRLDTIPFIWFWPSGYDSCVIVTHDVESEAGRDFCPSLMDLDDSFGIKSSFQIVPEGRYAVSPALLSDIRDHGFEINVHDLNHDGTLFRNQKRFMERVVAVNRYGKEFGTTGFRAGVMYRNQQWCHALEFEYDMSVPNVAHLEPQRGGCCTVFPYFIGQLLELPSTTTQDYALFHFLRQYSLDLWRQQIALIRQAHGMISILVHPDYIRENRARDVYIQLLHLLATLRSANKVWLSTPASVNQWWRARAAMALIPDGSGWRVQGPGSERARIAYARLDGNTISYDIPATRPESGSEDFPAAKMCGRNKNAR